MPLIRSDSGNKVGWETYDNEAEAKARAEQIAEQRDRMLIAGYDFGYCWPGEVTQARQYNDSHNASKGFTLLNEWTVTVP